MAVYINRLLENPPGVRRRNLVTKLEDWVAAMFTLSISPQVLLEITNVNFLLGIESFLANHNKAFRRRINLPITIEEDLEILLRKWKTGDGSMVPNRGLLTRNGGVSIDKVYIHYRKADVYGNNNLVNGQRFRSRIQMMRDGGHTKPQAGICGNLNGGAYAIVMGSYGEQQGRTYADIDQGNNIYYCGPSRKSDDTETTTIGDQDNEIMQNMALDTRILERSIHTKNPVRVFRSSNQAKICGNRPSKHFGMYRYDGLYEAISYKWLDKEEGVLRVCLRRLAGQGPIRDW